MKILASSDFKKIYLITDNSNVNTDYPVLEIYINNEKKYTSVVNGFQTINGESYSSTTDSDLDFVSTTTTTGTEYIEVIDSQFLNGTSDKVLKNGVWSFKLISDSEVTINIGAIVHDDIDCCIMNNLDSVCNDKCYREDVLNNANKIYAILYSANISAKKAEFTNALCKYNLAKTLCEPCTQN